MSCDRRAGPRRSWWLRAAWRGAGSGWCRVLTGGRLTARTLTPTQVRAGRPRHQRHRLPARPTPPRRPSSWLPRWCRTGRGQPDHVRRPGGRLFRRTHRARARGRSSHDLPPPAQDRTRPPAADLLDRAVHVPGPAEDVRHADPDPSGEEAAAIDALEHDGDVALDKVRCCSLASASPPCPGPSPPCPAGRVTGARVAWVPRAQATEEPWRPARCRPCCPVAPCRRRLREGRPGHRMGRREPARGDRPRRQRHRGRGSSRRARRPGRRRRGSRRPGRPRPGPQRRRGSRLRRGHWRCAPPR